jgi:hypothetical protein
MTIDLFGIDEAFKSNNISPLRVKSHRKNRGCAFIRKCAFNRAYTVYLSVVELGPNTQVHLTLSGSRTILLFVADV